MATAISNVRVFDGNGLTEPRTVVWEDGRISEKASGDQCIDGTGCTLLPGLIDSHIHLNGRENLEQAAKNGVTTMLDMMTDSAEVVDGLRNQPGLTDIRSCYQPVISEPGPMLMEALGSVSAYVTEKAQIRGHIEKQLEKGADYIKIILEMPPLTMGMLSEEMIREAVNIAHEQQKMTFAHTTSVEAYQKAVACGIDVLNHIPKESVLPDETIAQIKEKNLLVIPTMIMQKGMITALQRVMPERAGDYTVVEETVRRMHQAGISLIAGTDSNQTNKMNFIPHGTALHTELELLVQCGLTPAEALRSATCLPAQAFGLEDRGQIRPGLRADLLLVEGDPVQNISDTKKIKGVWIGGASVKDCGYTD